MHGGDRPRGRSRSSERAQPVVTLALTMSRVPAQRLYVFDRRRDDVARAALEKLCDETESMVEAAREAVMSAEAEQRTQRFEIRQAAAKRARAAEARASGNERSAAEGYEEENGGDVLH